MPILYIRPQKGEPWTVEIDKDSLSIGRGASNDVALADPNSSSRQAVIERAGDGFVLRDLGSKNGTFLNGRRIGCPETIVRGDEIKLGQTIVVFDRPRGPHVTVVDAPGTRLILRTTPPAPSSDSPPLRLENWRPNGAPDSTASILPWAKKFQSWERRSQPTTPTT